MKIGLIGCGNVAKRHVGAINGMDDVELVAVHDVEARRAIEVAAVTGAKACEVDELLDLSELVIVATPSGTHAWYGSYAAAAGCHVLVEKPIDVDPVAARRLIDDCHRNEVVLSVVSQHRFDPVVQNWKGMVDSGMLDPIVLVDGRVWWSRDDAYYRSSSWRGTRDLDGGVLMQQGIHTVDLLLWLFGPVLNVDAHAATRVHDIEMEDTLVAALRFVGGQLGTLSVTTCATPGSPETIMFTGPRCDVTLTWDRTPHQFQLRDVVQAIRYRCPPVVSGEDGLAALELVTAAYRSAHA